MGKWIFVTGGVISGLGKGVSAAAIGRLLKARGFKVFVQKLDPYLNVDPGTMNPYQHGEVYVTADGAETDLDLGHYERFIGEELTRASNYTSGQIYAKLLKDERQGHFQGATVQVIPHVTNAIRTIIENGAPTPDIDFVIVEVGGTVGDIESQAFIHAIAEMGILQPAATFFLHVSYIPYLAASHEFKTKPTQHALALLRSYAIRPNILLLRSQFQLAEAVKNKVARASLLAPEKVLAVHDTTNIYAIPLYLEAQNLAQQILDHFQIAQVEPQLDDWKEFVALSLQAPQMVLKIALVGKYTTYPEAYMSIVEALKITALQQTIKLELHWIKAAKMVQSGAVAFLKQMHGVIILPGFGVRGFAGKVATARYTRDFNIPTLGICYGMHAMVIEQAHRQGIKDPVSFENAAQGTFVIDIIAGQKAHHQRGGTLRLGNYTTQLKAASFAHQVYGTTTIVARHRHRYEVNPQFVTKLEDQQFQFSGFDEVTNLAEICELKRHRFYIGTQFHPEFTANPLRKHPLFTNFIVAAKQLAQGTESKNGS